MQSIRTRALAIPPYFTVSSRKQSHWLKLAHALTGAPDFPFGSNSRIASYFPPHRLAPTVSSLNEQRNITYSYQSFSYVDILTLFVQFVNRFYKKSYKCHKFKFSVSFLTTIAKNGSNSLFCKFEPILLFISNNLLFAFYLERGKSCKEFCRPHSVFNRNVRAKYSYQNCGYYKPRHS